MFEADVAAALEMHRLEHGGIEGGRDIAVAVSVPQEIEGRAWGDGIDDISPLADFNAGADPALGIWLRGLQIALRWRE